MIWPSLLIAQTDEKVPHRSKAIGVELGAVAALIALNVALYRKIVRLWWIWDDPATLRLVLDRTWWQPFVDGASWPRKMFTPLLTLFFELQLALFDLDAGRYYVLHLVMVAATAIAVYGAMRSFTGPGPALSGAVVFLAGAPLCSIVTQLSTIHYFLAVFFAALAVMFWRWAGISALLYLLSLLAKEVAAPLPLVLLALPHRDLRWRVRHCIGHFVAFAVYYMWRGLVLETFGGGYGWAIGLDDWRPLLLFPWKLLRLATGSEAVLAFLLVAMIVMVLALGIRSRRGWLVVLLAMVLAAAPYAPMAKDLAARFAVVPWLTIAAAFAAAASRVKDRRLRAAILIAVPVLAILANRAEWSRELRYKRRMSDENRFFFYDLPANGLLRNPALTGHDIGELNWLRTDYMRREPGGICFYDDLYLLANDVRDKRVWEYDPGRRAVVEITEDVPAIVSRQQRITRMNAPLSARFTYRDATLHWDLGPYDRGRYSALFGNGLRAGEIGRRDALRFPVASAIALRIRYDSPDGWMTYSPELTLDLTKSTAFSWSR